jgi:hypothetical protein
MFYNHLFLIRNVTPVKRFLWIKCLKPQTKELKSWAMSGLKKRKFKSLSICERSLAEALDSGLSRPQSGAKSSSPRLADFAKVIRGIATGANEFFFLTQRNAAELGIPSSFLKPAIGRTRDIIGDEITPEMIRALEAKGRPTLLFSPDGRPIESFPPSVREYLRKGETLGIHKRALITTRNPWYKMETRSVPPILFAYLGRRNARFIRNRAGVIPLTGFLCVFPHRSDAASVNKLYEVLNHPRTIHNLRLVGKSYGAGAVKVEPRALENLRLPAPVLASSGLEPGKKFQQLELSFRDPLLPVAKRA